MARRRLRKNERTYISLAVGSLFVIAIFIWLISQIVWNSVAGAMLVFLLGACAIYSIFHFGRIIWYQIKKSQRFDAASRIKGKTDMKFLSPTEFEHYVATMYQKLGYHVNVTKQSGDGGIDVILKNGQEIAAVQVKRYSDKNVGRPEVQNLVGASNLGFNKRIVVTTSDFTKDAIEYAAQHGVTLINGATLEFMAKEAFGDDFRHKSFSFAFQHRMTK